MNRTTVKRDIQWRVQTVTERRTPGLRSSETRQGPAQEGSREPMAMSLFFDMRPSLGNVVATGKEDPGRDGPFRWSSPHPWEEGRCLIA